MSYQPRIFFSIKPNFKYECVFKIKNITKYYSGATLECLV